MESRVKHKKFWKPPSSENFNALFPNKKIKLDPDDDERIPSFSKEIEEPKTSSELAIHPKKIQEVTNWLKSNKNSRAAILCVTGPAGCGKMTALKVVAREEGIQIKEWINPINKTEFKPETILDSDIYDKFSFTETSQTGKFEDFIFKSSRYNSLFGVEKSKLILVKDIPNVFIWSPKTFHDFLEKFKSYGKSPIVFIVTDDQNMNVSSNLFPNHIKCKHNITTIKFNKISHSSSMKILRTFCDFLSSEKVSLQLLEEISKNSGGDLRSALNDLMLVLRTNGFDINQKCKKSRKSRKDGLLIKNKSLSLKNDTFDFYHVLGRIIYPKLMTEQEKLNSVNPKQIFLHDVQKLADSLSNSSLGILHENYVQTFTKIQDMVEGADCFSFCDVLESHQELVNCASLVGVVTLMLKNTAPRKTGFHPIKKSFRFEETNTDFSVDVPGDFCHHLSKRDIMMDVKPFLKFLKTHEEGNKRFADVSENCPEYEDFDLSEEIEDFDD